VRIRCADYVTPLHSQNLALTSPTSGSRSVGIIRSRSCSLYEFSSNLLVILSEFIYKNDLGYCLRYRQHAQLRNQMSARTGQALQMHRQRETYRRAFIVHSGETGSSSARCTVYISVAHPGVLPSRLSGGARGLYCFH
jgi:hypothetical protein